MMPITGKSFDIKSLAKDWNTMFLDLIDEKKIHPVLPYQPSIAYKNGEGYFQGDTRLAKDDPNRKEFSSGPEISILCPTMRPGGLDVLFRSLEKQTFKNFELILVDGIYKYREDIVRQMFRHYKFPVKYIEPINNSFPTTCLAHTTNTGFVNCAAPIVLMITDYTYLPPDCVEKHVKFHKDNPQENIGYMCPHQYKALPELNHKFPTYRNEDIKLLVRDLDNKSLRMNNCLWSIFREPFNIDPEILPLDSMGNADNKLFAEYGVGDHQAFNAKNESLKISAVLKINGWDEELDGAHLCQDNVFSDMLVKLLDFKWTVDKNNKVFIINPRFVMPHAFRPRHHLSNYPIWRKKQDIGYKNKINMWNLEETRNNILHGTKHTDIIKLDLGSGKTTSTLNVITLDHTNWKHIDINPDYNPTECYDITTGIREKDNSVDQVWMGDIFEHFTRTDALFVMKEVYRVLKSGGKLQLSCPDMEAAMDKYLKSTTEEDLYQNGRLIWGEQDTRPNCHLYGYTEKSLRFVLESVGFTDIKRVKIHGVWFALEVECLK